ncbi:C-GCAxxG-C-C family protein [Dethiobacter alkaliphilus]|nr:C-GCAxxG-C-C family protein [Dethiobacter alkaliphilus]
MSQKGTSVSRRKFLMGAGALATGVMAMGVVGCADTVTGNGNVASAQALPWTYKKLDVEKVRKRGYEGYFEGGCCYAAATALLETLREDNGSPWDTIPQDMFRYGAGGAYSWGTLCGALNGSLAVINLARENHPELGNELVGWYTEFPFPTDKHESYCNIPDQITTVAKSPLCHISVSTWANAAGATVNSDEKADRCAKLSGDTAAYAAQLLNDALENNFAPAFTVSDEYSHCMDCHTGKDSVFDNQQGKMSCTSCHDDHTKE